MSSSTDVQLGINTCFAVKRWPRPPEWIPIVRDELGLDLVQHSLDLVDFAASDAELLEEARENPCRLRWSRDRGAVDLHRPRSVLEQPPAGP